MTLTSPHNKMNLIRALNVLHKVKRFGKAKSEPAFQVFRKHPITRGMASYLFIWPVGNIIQQTLSDQEKFDVWKIIRFGLYGALITAPSLYAWVRLSTSMYPNTNLRIACAKVRYIGFSHPNLLNSLCSHALGTHRTNLVHPAGDVHFLLQHDVARNLLSG